MKMADRPAPYLQEFETLDHILSRVGHKSQRNVLSKNVEWTCIDVTREYVAIGTNSSIVCLYDRLSGQVKKLNLRLKGVSITRVKLINSVDYEVAVGTSSGQLFIYVLPSQLTGKNRTLQVFTVPDLHPAAITCLEWSQNAMKLFSGDLVGNVACTEIDYLESTSKSRVLCNESYEIVQLSYTARTLVISSIYRSVVCPHGQSENITQVGTKDRKILGPFGAVIKPSSAKTEETVIFASRPGLRLWQAKLDGKVMATYIFKELVKERSKNVSLLANTCMGLIPHSAENYQFGRLLIYQQSYILSYHGTELYVIDPGIGTFSSYHTNLGHIQDVAVCDDEVFVLRNVTGRVLLRLACKPEQRMEMPFHLPLKRDNNSMSHSSKPRIDGSPVQVLSGTASKMSHSVIGLFKEVGEKIQSVTEGHKASRSPGLPPWGVVSERATSLEYIAEPMSKSVGSPDGSVDSAHEAIPSAESSPTKTSPKHEVITSETAFDADRPGQDHDTRDDRLQSFQDPAPVIKLDGDQLVVLTTEYTSHKQEQVEGCTEKAGRAVVDNSLHDELNHHEDEEQLVYFQKTKKRRKKKVKSDIVNIGSADPAEHDASSPANTTSGVSSNPPVISGRACTDLDTNGYSKVASSDASQSHASGQPNGDQKKNLALGIDLEKLKGEESIDVFGLLKEHKISHTGEDKATSCDKFVQDSGANTDSEIIPSQQVICKETDVEQAPSAESATAERQTTEEDKAGDPAENSGDIDRAGCSDLPTEHEDNVKHTDDQTAAQATAGDLSREALHLNLNPNSEGTKANQDMSQSESGSSVISPGTLTRSSSNLSRKSASEGEDFYSLYNAQPFSPTTPDVPRDVELSLEATIDRSNRNQTLDPTSTGNLHASPKNPVADVWDTFTAPGSVSSMSLTDKHIWFVDKKEKIHYSALDQPALNWNVLPEGGKQISVSPDGWIVWRLYKNAIYVATGISSCQPAGNTWREIARDVAYISVDNHMAWYIKLNGELGMHKSLAKNRPCHRFIKVDCPHQVTQVCCHNGVIWALTVERNIIVRIGMKPGVEEGIDWVFLQGEGPCQLVSSFALGNHQTAWILDLVGRVWFTTGVTADKPTGSGFWWQVSMSEYLMQDSRASYLIKTLFDVPQNLNRLIAADKGGIIKAGKQGIWLCPGGRNTFHVCCGNMMGHRWENCILSNLIPSTKWLHVSASAISGGEGRIWALQNSGSLFLFPSNYKNARILEVAAPEGDLNIRTVSASGGALWLLKADGQVFVRADIAAHCPQGLHWARLSLAQLGDSKVIHLSCGSQTVWAVDDSGTVYMRIGVQAPAGRHLDPAWVAADGCPKDASSKFDKVFVGTNDKMVWAIDNKNFVYVRRGVTEDLPLGQYWCYVSGTKAMTLCVSNHTVYALNLNGEVLIRYGITDENIDGNYWKKIPGAFSALSVTADEELWALDKDNLMYKRHLHYLRCHPGAEEAPSPPEGNPEEGWELL